MSRSRTDQLWAEIRDELGPIIASLIVGVVFVLAGAVVMFVRRMPPEPTAPTLADQLRREAAAGTLYEPRGQFPPLLEAFQFGASLTCKSGTACGGDGSRGFRDRI